MSKSRILVEKPVWASLALAFVSTIGVSAMLKAPASLFTISNSVFSVVIFAAVLYLIRFVRLKKLLNRRLLFVSAIIGFIFSLFMVAGVNVIQVNSTLLNKLTTWIQIVCGMIPWIYVLTVFMEYLLPKFIGSTSPGRAKNILNRFFNTKHYFVFVWGLIIIAWIPTLLAAYPGIYGYDSIYQVAFYQSGKIVLHHPLIHTYLLGFFVVNVGDWLHSRELGLLLYSILQILILSSSLAFLQSYITRKRNGMLFPLVSLLIIMFLPVNAIMAVSATKDIIYTALFLVVEILLVKIALDQGANMRSRFMAGFIMVAFFNIIFRSQGIYVFVITALFAFIVWRKIVGLRKLFFMFIIPVLLFTIYSGPVTKALHGVKFDSIHEMMSVPAVQMSRAVYYDNGQLSTEQRSEAVEYFPAYRAISYNAGISDIMKNSFNTRKFKKSPITFFKVWLSIGLTKPMSYIDAFARLTIGLWYPDMNYRDPQAYHPYWEYHSWSSKSAPKGNYTFVGRKSVQGFGHLSKVLEKLSYENSYQKVGMLSVLFSSGMYSWVLIVFIGWIFYKRQYKLLVPASFMFAYFLTLLLGPVVMYRYVFPLAVTGPLMILVMGTTLAGQVNRNLNTKGGIDLEG